MRFQCPTLSRLALVAAVFSSAPAQAGGGLFDGVFGNYLAGRTRVDLALNPTSTDGAFALLVLPDNRLLLAGSASTPGGSFMVAMRLTSAGAVDSGFGSQGVASIAPAGAESALALSVLRQADGKLILVGNASYAGNPDFVACRLTADGQLDTNYALGGCRRYGLDLTSNATDQVGAAALDSIGRLVIAGHSSNGITFMLSAIRLLSDGSLDSSFGANGRTVVQRFSEIAGSTTRESAGDIAIVSASGRILIAGTTMAFSNYAFGIAALDANGVLDPSFGNSGAQRIDFDLGGTSDEGKAVGLQRDGRILMAGTVQRSGTDYDFGIVRLTSSGAVDSTFAGSGKQAIGFYPSTPGIDHCYDLVVQNDDRIVLAGYAPNPSNGGASGQDLALLRLLKNGAADSSFGNSPAGRFTGGVDIGGGGGSNHDRLFALAMQANRVVAVGEALRTSSDRDIIAIRLTEDTVHSHGFEF